MRGGLTEGGGDWRLLGERGKPAMPDLEQCELGNFLCIFRKACWDDSKDYIPYSISLYSLADDMRALDYAYAQAYGSQFGENYKKHEYHSAKFELVKTLMEYETDTATIAMVLNYPEEDVIEIKSEIERERKKVFEEGRAAGRAEAIRFMLSLGIDPDTIAKQYEMTIGEINKLSD